MKIDVIWQRYDADEARLTAPLSQRMLELAEAQSGDKVLDLATGRGEPAIAACQLVAPHGIVVGVDTASSMLEMARQRAAREGVENLELVVADAQQPLVHSSAPFDIVLSRWGLMYMPDPVAALRSAWTTTRPDAILVAALWAEPERVDYYSFPRSILERYTSIAPIDFAEPGPFRLSSMAVIERDFALSGWCVEHSEELYVDVMEAHSDRELIDWCCCFGMQRLLEPLPSAVQQNWQRDLVAACRPRPGTGTWRLGGITRIVAARRVPKKHPLNDG